MHCIPQPACPKPAIEAKTKLICSLLVVVQEKRVSAITKNMFVMGNVKISQQFIFI
jgi:nitrate reductase NapAB chaperone NapD